VALHPQYPDYIGIWNCWSLRRGENQCTSEKPLGARRKEPRTNSTQI